MNKINIVILCFLTFSYFQTNAMTKLGGTGQISEQIAGISMQVANSFKQTNRIKNRLLRLKDFDAGMSEDAKISKITDLLSSYQEAHRQFIHHRLRCNPEYLLPKYLKEYCFCDLWIQDKFQAKADALLGGYVLDLNQWFEEMRSVEYEALLIPYRLING